MIKASAARSAQDKFVCIRDVWDRFIYNCIGAYKPDRNLAVDEQLFACKNRCSFIQFMPNKPGEFGLKFWVLADLSTKYVCNMIPFLGKSEDKSSDVLLGESVVMKLM